MIIIKPYLRVGLFMLPQKFIKEYGISYARSVSKTSCIWDMYYDTSEKRYTSHNLGEHCVCLEDLRVELLQDEVERVSCHAVIVWYGMIVFWLLLIGLLVWWLV